MDLTNRELKIMLDSIEQKQNEKHHDIMDALSDIKVDLKETKIQTLKTNGRVSKLEWWRNALIWGFGAILGLLAFMIPYTISFVRFEIQNTVDTSITAALSQYDIHVSN